MDADLLRNLTLAVPLAAVVVAVAVSRKPSTGDDRPVGAGAFLAGLWVFLGVIVVERFTDFWEFAPAPTSCAGIPLEVALGWALVWGALPALVGGPLLLWWLGFAWLDLLLMPRLDPLVVLGNNWVWGELLMLGVVAAPALVLGRATRHRTHLYLRVCLQVVLFAGLVLWLLPSMAFAADGTSWSDLWQQPLIVRAAALLASVSCGVPALAAVAEVARMGGGTPFPWDPPVRLVTTGPYAYLANPMQVGATGLLIALALAARSPALLLGAVVAVVFSMAVAEPHERTTLAARWPGYLDYREHVHGWRPRWRPWVNASATLWVSETCQVCRAFGGGIRWLRPRGLDLRPAEAAGVRVTRMRWAGGSPAPDRGVAALARALEHANLGTAWIGWLIRLPVVTPLLHIVVDGVGLGPRAVPRARASGRMQA